MDSSSRASRILRLCLEDENNTDTLETSVDIGSIEVQNPNYVELENIESGEPMQAAESSAVPDNLQQYTMEMDEKIDTKFVLRKIENGVVSKVSDHENLETVSDESNADLNLSDDSIADPSFSSSESTSSDESTSSNELTLSDESSPPSSSSKRGKKRVIRISARKKETAKRLRNMGKEYQSVSKTSKIIKAREILAPCTDKCKLSCSTKFSENQRKTIFNNYWALGNLEQQRSFIAGNIESIQPKYRYTRTENHRKLNNAFYFQIEAKKLRVCKLFFKNTLGINDRPIRTVLEKKRKWIS
ncbi:uncharacterized protein LOC128868612 isoform X2 [Anastrepha ludens]|uniref:uncharacterized protein LOC128868612 isoform X2 n=1 Tax=Anastrepha ludens TaxID=28586 RepID=UPI0023B1B6B0|nr:uncharacterized protein LOC128868612 isoform X2 [Anastrepha ludens]